MAALAATKYEGEKPEEGKSAKRLSAVIAEENEG